MPSIIKSNTRETFVCLIDWTAAWSGKYPVLKTNQSEVDVSTYSSEIRRLLTKLQEDYGYSDLDAMLVLKDILAHEYMDNRRK